MIEDEDAQPSDVTGHVITLMLDLYLEVITLALTLDAILNPNIGLIEKLPIGKLLIGILCAMDAHKRIDA